MPFHHPSEARKVFRFRDQIRAHHENQPTRQAGGQAATGFARVQKRPLAGRNAIPVYKWCWVTFGEQSRFISRLFRSFDATHGEGPVEAAGEYGKTLARRRSKLALPYI